MQLRCLILLLLLSNLANAQADSSKSAKELLQHKKLHTLSILKKGKVKESISEAWDIVLITSDGKRYEGQWKYLSATKIIISNPKKTDTIELSNKVFNFKLRNKERMDIVGGALAIGVIYWGVRLDSKNRPDSTVIQYVNLKIAGIAIVAGTVGVFQSVFRLSSRSNFQERKKVTVRLDYKP